MTHIKHLPPARVAVTTPEPLWPLLRLLTPHATQSGAKLPHVLRVSAQALERLDQFAALTAGVGQLASDYQARVDVELALDRSKTTLRVLRGEQPPAPRPQKPLPPSCSSIGIKPKGDLGWHELAQLQRYIDHLEAWLIEQLESLPTLDNLRSDLAACRGENTQLIERRYQAFWVERALRAEALATANPQAPEVDQDDVGASTGDMSLDDYELALQAYAIARSNTDTQSAGGAI